MCALLTGVRTCALPIYSLVGLAQHRAVDAGQPFLFDLGAKPLLDRIIGARAKVEVDQLRGALAQAVADIVARDDEIDTTLVLPAHDDMGVRVDRKSTRLKSSH